jgi:alpha-amylase/alpha-mannosidase (GH57 family)
MNRYICIHGHFYQPPRENPWLEEIEIEDSAYPFHDWNERITAECYAPNASSRILGSGKEIVDIVNNYSRISYDFGPTLLSWLEKHNPELYAQIILADRESQKRFSGHGSAIAQVYNHIIMPLANTRDKRTEVIWGIRDFISRFNRKPEGMWLPETAVDTETLDILAEQGILFTILSPEQAKRVSSIRNPGWTDVHLGRFDISKPYLCKLPTGRSINIFFFNHGIASEIAFGTLLNNGEEFAHRMVSTFSRQNGTPKLLSIATDGETYGHHHRFADMALAYAIHTIESKHLAEITVFGEFLEKYPPTDEVEIQENTSWSCIHGIERWRSNCGCRTYHACLVSDPHIHVSPARDSSPFNPRTWNQKWRTPLRQAMDHLNTSLSELYQKETAHLFSDAWVARDEYITIVLDRSEENLDWFFSRNIERGLSPDKIVKALKLLEIQRNALLMFTSCGWFFDEISGIESVQVMMYACRAMQLVQEVTGVDLEPMFTGMLKNARSNLAESGTGADIYSSYVSTAVVDISRVAFHYAIMSLIKQYPDEATIYTYTIRSVANRQGEAGFLKLITGHAIFSSELTHEDSSLVYAAIHIGDHNFLGGVGAYTTEETFSAMQNDLWNAFIKSDIPGMIISLNQHFESHSYSLWHLFRDGRREVLYSILQTTLDDVESEYRQIYRRYFSLIRAMKEMHAGPPEALEFPVQYILNHDIKQSLESDTVDLLHLKIAVDEIVHGHYKPDSRTLSYIAGGSITWQLKKISLDPKDIERIRDLNIVFLLIKPLSLTLDLLRSQDQYFRIRSTLFAHMQEDAEQGDDDAREWVSEFDTLGINLGVLKKNLSGM